MNMKAHFKFLPILFSLFCLSCSGTSSFESITTGKVEFEYDDLVISSKFSEVSLDAYTTYYVDSASGDDSNDGLSIDSPIKSISKVDTIIKEIKENPTRILFKAGTTYENTLNVVSFEASEQYPLLISSYGEENNGYAKFVSAPYGINVSGSNVRISKLEITNIEAERGINVFTTSQGALKNIVFEDNYIHDINFNFENGLPSQYQGQGLTPKDVDISFVSPASVTPNGKFIYQCAGIYFNAGTMKAIGPSWFENVWIKGNRIEQVSRAGVFFDSQWVKRPGIEWGNNTYINDDLGWYPSKNVNVVNNYLDYMGGDGVVLLGVNGGVMEYNTCYNAQYLGRGAYYCCGLWCHSTINYTIQYNEVAYTHLLNGSGDGEGFDIDKSCKNITFQYNYSHHNDGGGILLCTNSEVMTIYNEDGTPVRDDDGLPHRERRFIWGPVTIRNNVFADNGGTVFETSDALKDLSIYNNTIVMPGNSGEEKLINNGSFTNNVLCTGLMFENNIVYLRNNRTLDSGVSHFKDPKFSSNLFYNFNEDFLSIFPLENTYSFDPKLNIAEAKKGFDNAKDFICSSSSVVEQGELFNHMNKYDFEGNDSTDKRYLGAFSTFR